MSGSEAALIWACVQVERLAAIRDIRSAQRAGTVSVDAAVSAITNTVAGWIVIDADPERLRVTGQAIEAVRAAREAAPRQRTT